MSTQTQKKTNEGLTNKSNEISQFFGNIFSFNSSLKLIHWAVTGEGSYAAHISLDEAISTLLEVTDRLVETTYASDSNLNIVIPETKRPENYINYIEGFYDHIDANRKLFTDTFTQSILDDYQEGIKQLLFRLKRLK